MLPPQTPTMLSNLLPKYNPALFSEIHELSPYLDPDANSDSIRFIAYVAGVITIGHLLLLQAVKLYLGKHNDCTDDKNNASTAAWKASYQMTNCFVNLVLGCLGIYYHMQLPLDATYMDKIVGYEHMKLFPIGQIGYQLWALPIGIIFIGETKQMIIHHIAVICVCSTSAFIRCGFRYYNPYFYGLIEISSVPLSIMNAFKDNKHWIKLYPEMYSTVRLIFGCLFLLVRVVLWTPFYWNFFALESMLLYSSEVITTKIILATFLCASLVLTFLQYFWASKIISALVKGPPSEHNADPTKKTN